MEIRISQPFALNEQGGRANNEDAVFPEKGSATTENRLFIVCDGVGGLQAGEVASRTVCQAMASRLERFPAEGFSAVVFQQALDFAYDQLDAVVGDSKAGTTLAFLFLSVRGAFIAHIGDSRVYHLRKASGVWKLYKTQDHSLVNDMLRAGMLNEEEARNHSKKNVITRAMQPHPTQRARADIYETTDVQSHDYFFLCSDGILEQIDDDLLKTILRDSDTAEEMIRRMHTLCEGNTKDNFSAYLVPVQSVTE